MIQRIQTIYMIIAAIISGVLTQFVSFFSIQENAITLFKTFSIDSYLVKSVGVLIIFSTILSVISIFKYQNRQLQFVLNRLNILSNFYILSVLLYVSLSLPGEIGISEKGIGVYFPIVIIVLLAMANKAIKKDDNLVKSVDRLR